eukprot:1681300-Rhodomonas_salina.2
MSAPGLTHCRGSLTRSARDSDSESDSDAARQVREPWLSSSGCADLQVECDRCPALTYPA